MASSNFLITRTTCASLLLLLAQQKDCGSADAASCIESNEEFNAFFEIDKESDRRQSIPRFGSCCMQDVCGLACPTEDPPPDKSFRISMAISIAVCFIIGLSTYSQIKGSAENFFVAGRSLPLFVLVMTLAAQSVDSNSLLGNIDNSYALSFWDGAVLPIGLGMSLFINGAFLAHKVHQDNVLTLPDIFAKRYGTTVELLVSTITIISFVMLLAGNLVGMGVIAGHLWSIDETGAIWISSAVVWSYTATGGLFSVAYTDVFQASIGFIGCLSVAFWFITNEEFSASPPSIGFPGYIYPDLVGDGGICDMYEGVPCTVDPSKCCYNSELWCPNGAPNCERYDRGAFPLGDERVYNGQMSDALALSPYPNGIFWNWASIIILAFGNVAALDFQARCMASKTSGNARLGCVIAGSITMLVGIPFSFLGGITRVYYGPDSPSSVYTVDSCHEALGLATCAKWEPDPTAFLKLLGNHAPPFLGCWCMVGMMAATMSTADGAILALGTVMSNNFLRQLDRWFPRLITPENLLLMARVSTLPLTIISTSIGAYYRSSDDHAAGATGSLLIVAFDVVFATVVVPLFGAFYTKNPSPRAALLSILSGGFTRLISEFALPKDGSLLLPFEHAEFLDYGKAASVLKPAFWDVNATDVWDPSVDQCFQEPNGDFTGVDSLTAGLVGLVVFVLVQYLENKSGRPLFSFPGSTGYEKGTDKDMDKIDDWTTMVEVLFVVVGLIYVIFTVFLVLLTSPF